MNGFIYLKKLLYYYIFKVRVCGCGGVCNRHGFMIGSSKHPQQLFTGWQCPDCKTIIVDDEREELFRDVCKQRMLDARDARKCSD